jgi:DNA-binding winged helix-turn-helix (wHTH) protein/Tol biopolymer transport system component
MKQVSLLPSFNNTIVQLGEFVLNTQNGELRKTNVLVKIEPQLLEFLLLLIQQKLTGNEAIVTREMMIETIWSGKTASDDAIRAVVKKLREVLKDDARRPSYIKTIPTKGYLLICEVEQRTQGTLAWKQRLFKYGLVTMLALILFAGGQFTYLWYLSKDDEPIRASTVKVLSEDIKTYVSADYHNKNGFLYSKIASNDNSLQLYVKNNEGDDGKRLTWDLSHDHIGRWSPDGKYILIQKYNASNRDFSVYEYPSMQKVFGQEMIGKASVIAESQQTQLIPISWLHEEDQILIYGKADDNQNQIALYAYSITNKILKLKTSISLQVDNIHAIEVSNDSQFLAIHYQDTNDNSLLTIFNRFTNEIIDTVRLEVKVKRIVWDSNNQLISYLLDGVGLRSYDITARKQISWQGLQATTQSLIGQCGPNCFMFTQHNGDFLDIQEIRSPMVDENIIMTRLIESSGLDDMPVYGNDGSLYYVTRLDGRSLIEKRDTDNKNYQIFELPSSGIVKSLSINKTNTALIGELDNRIFLYRLDTGVFSFVTGIRENARSPSWLNDDSGFIFTKFRETEKTDSQTKQALESSLPVYVHYEIATSSKRELGQAFQSVIHIAENRYLVSKDNTSYTLAEAESLVALFQNADVVKFSQETSIVLKLSSPNAFQIINSKLYFLTQTTSNTELNVVDLESLEMTPYSISGSAYNQHFSISNDLRKLAITSNKSTASRIIQINGLWHD